MKEFPLDQILPGDCVEVMQSLPAESVDLIFADPPYNLQLHSPLYRPDMSRVDPVADSWDQFDSFAAYDEFTRAWLQACRRVLKPTGTIWVIGSYHNIFRVGTIMQDLGFWILNDVIWIKTNPMPNFRGVRFTNAHETMIWASMGPGVRYTFNHQAMKGLNNEKQMRSDWWLVSLAKGGERLKDEHGDKAHSTQKPEDLLYRVILSASNPGDVVLDPFFGSGTTGVVAKRLHRNWIGIERKEDYIPLAQQRIDQVVPAEFVPEHFHTPSRRDLPRVPFGQLVEKGYLEVGQALYFRKKGTETASVLADGRLAYNGQRGTIHTIAKRITNAPANGWDLWYYEDEYGERHKINKLREQIRGET